MGAVTVRDGKLTASSETIERLRALCDQDKAMLASGDARTSGDDHPRLFPKSTSAGDGIEATLVRLVGETSAAATRAFGMARAEAHPGGNAEIYALCVGQGSRAALACAQLADALARHQGKPARVEIEHRQHPTHQRIA
jgi:hypothetical protein